ncbi:hypothetical protein [Cupriavidus pinatubonensis]|uniref:Uncharacterized protein n=1 Tax=Cupriavidus pinatubonensis TaxID=248026 RepID=A0ABN7YLQ5_9BURK|nr:hypothetical protein [Cupriavidus pinatubonensis]CAG9173341.1 hypothetical protein LMG23994_02617 [Cupriavidus pinatubonensis]
MSIGLLAAVMATLLCMTVAVALWRCSHPYRMRYRRCARHRQRMGICRQAVRH